MKRYLWGLALLLANSLVSTSACAALIGELPATPGRADYQAYYDPGANLTWLANTSPEGLISWQQAQTWTQQLVINGVTGWRLPKADLQCPIGAGQPFCDAGELGNLFYNVLGGTADTAISQTHNANYALFSNIDSSNRYHDVYWELPGFPGVGPLGGVAFLFDLSYGSEGDSFLDNARYHAWAVHAGNVADPRDVPEPSGLWIVTPGLMFIGWRSRRRGLGHAT